MILLKRHADGVVSLCDDNLLGKTFEKGDLQLTVPERFYKGKEATKDEITKALKDAKTINLVGEESVKLALDEGFITKGSIKRIANTPHAQIFTL